MSCRCEDEGRTGRQIIMLSLISQIRGMLINTQTALITTTIIEKKYVRLSRALADNDA